MEEFKYNVEISHLQDSQHLKILDVFIFPTEEVLATSILWLLMLQVQQHLFQNSIEVYNCSASKNAGVVQASYPASSTYTVKMFLIQA